MSYCSLASLLDRVPERELIEVTDDDGVGVLDEARVEGVIADTDSRIDSYLRTRYTLPLANIPVELERAAAILIVYDLRARTESITDQLQQRYDQTISYLKDLSAGRATLDVEDPTPPVRAARWGTNERERKWSSEYFKKIWS